MSIQTSPVEKRKRNLEKGNVSSCLGRKEDKGRQYRGCGRETGVLR